MSLVGTRPILQDELRQYELHHRARIAIKPGITGMWQVSGRSDITDFEEVVSKMFCKSRKSWKNMPSGLLQTVLCDEKLQQSYERTDELFYYTMQEIVNRLETSTSVIAPVDDGRDLTPRNIDHQRMTNWKNRLKSKLEDLEVLFSEDCTKDDAIQAWYVLPWE